MSRSNPTITYSQMPTPAEKRALLSAVWMSATKGDSIHLNDSSTASAHELREKLRGADRGEALRARLARRA